MGAGEDGAHVALVKGVPPKDVTVIAFVCKYYMLYVRMHKRMYKCIYSKS